MASTTAQSPPPAPPSPNASTSKKAKTTDSTSPSPDSSFPFRPWPLVRRTFLSATVQRWLLRWSSSFVFMPLPKPHPPQPKACSLQPCLCPPWPECRHRMVRNPSAAAPPTAIFQHRVRFSARVLPGSKHHIGPASPHASLRQAPSAFVARPACVCTPLHPTNGLGFTCRHAYTICASDALLGSAL
jgi:hypothetical protein